MIATAFKNPWPLEIGRIDSDEPGPNRVPAPDADVETIKVRDTGCHHNFNYVMST